MQSLQRIKKLFLDETGLISFGVVSGIIIHFIKLSNDIFNHDSMIVLFSNSSWLLRQGKWFSNTLSTLKGPLVVRYMAGIIGILWIVASCILLIEILEICDALSKRIVMLLLLASPSVMLCMIYDGMDYFGATFLLAILSVYIGKGYSRLSWLGATVCLTLSLGSYQGYIGAAAVLFLYICLKKAFILKENTKDIIREGLYYMSILATAIVLYYIILQIALKINGVELSSYKGADNMMSILYPGALFWAVIKAYSDAISFLWNDKLGMGEFYTICLYRLLVIVFLIVVLIRLIQLLKEKLYINASLSIILIALLPLAANSVGVLSNNASFYLVTAYPLVLLFVIGYNIIFEVLKEVRYKKIGYVCIYGLMLAVIMKMVILTNIQYEKAKYGATQINAKMIELATLMHNVEGVTEDTPVIMIGKYPFRFLRQRGTATIYEPFLIDEVGGANRIISDVSQIEAYLEYNLSYSFNFVQLEGDPSQEMKEMPVYPEKGSIRMDEQGRLIVKFGDVETE